jgi:hypothetical protein
MYATPAPTEGPITTAPAPGAPGWRAPVIGLVAILAVGIGVALGAYLLGGRSAGVGVGAGYVPADVPMYIEIRLEPSAQQDAALRELLRRFPAIDGLDLDRPLSETLAERLDETLAAAGASVSWSADIDPWFDGHVAVAILDGAFAAPDMTDPTAMPAAPPVLLMLGVTDRGAAATAIERLRTEMGDTTEFTESTYTGLTVYESAGGEGAYVLTDDQLLLAPNVQAIRDALDAHASGETLAATGDLAGHAAQLPSDWLVLVTYDYTGVIADAFAQGAAQQPGMAEAFEELFAHQPLRGAGAISATGDGIAIDAFTDVPTGEFAPSNADRGLADEVPADALYFSDAGNVGPGLAATLDALADALATDPMLGEQVRTFESALGGDFGDLVSWIGDGAAFVGAGADMPYAGLVLVPTDVEQARQRLGQLGSFAQLASSDPASGITVTETAVETAGGPVTVTTINWQPPAGDPAAPPMPVGGPMAIEYAVTDDRAVITVGAAGVGALLDLDPADSLAANPRYTDAVAALGGATNANVVWADFDAIQDVVEAALAGMPMPPEAGGVDLASWFEPLDRYVGVTRVEGDRLEGHAVLYIE